MDKINAPNRKTGRMMAKNLIILLALALIAALAIWAWFTHQQSATAEGISISTIASGVQVSWTGTDGTYYNNLTARDNADVDAETGLAKQIDEADSKLKLVTGNGLNFFAPSLNKRTGAVLKNGNEWLGSVINADNSQGSYVDLDLYFRSDAQKTVYLAQDSKAEPKDVNANKSEYGNFSKDYICSAARLAFLDSTKNDCNFIWAPNSDYQLTESENGYSKYTTTDTDTITETTGGVVDGGATEDGNSYSFWTLDPSSDYTGGEYRVITKEYEFVYDSSIHYYTADVVITVPSYTATNASVPFILTKNGAGISIDANASFQNNSNNSLIKISNNTYNGAWYDGNEVSANQYYFTNTASLVAGTHVTITVGYNPNGVVTVLGYSGNDNWNKGDETTTVTKTVTYFPLDNGVNVALANAADSVAVSTATTSLKKSVIFNNNNITPASITTSEQFTTAKTGDKSKATYKFKNVRSQTFLTLNGTSISMTSKGTEFTLAYVDGVDSPVLQSGNYYVVYSGGKFTAVTKDNLGTADVVTVFTGNSYTMLTGSTELQTYQYYDNTAKDVVPLNSSSTPPLFASVASGQALNKVCDKSVVTLTKANETDKYYTGHIVIRIWAEGTDRDALTPLAGGIFDTSLHFISEITEG